MNDISLSNNFDQPEKEKEAQVMLNNDEVSHKNSNQPNINSEAQVVLTGSSIPHINSVQLDNSIDSQRVPTNNSVFLNNPNLPVSSFPEKPHKLVTIMVLTMLSGIYNVLGGLICVSFFLPLTVMGILQGLGLKTTFIVILIFSIISIPFLIVLALGICEIIYVSKLISTSSKNVKPARKVAIFEIISLLYGNIFGLLAGIFAFIFYEDKDVQNYFSVVESVKQSNSAPKG